MTEKHPPSDGSHRTGDVRSRWERRKFLAIGGGVCATLFAGCTSDSVPGDDPDDGADDGADDPDGESNFRLLVSDRPADIDDFDSLEVTFDSARVFQGGEETEEDQDETGSDESTVTEDETETDPAADDDGTAEAEDETENGDAGEDSDDGAEDSDDGEGDDEGSRGYVEFDLDGPTVDLTEVVGEKAMAVTEGHLEAGTYQKLELHVSDVEGVVDGNEVEVKVPSEKLQLTKPFEVVAGETVDFVFDINVVKRGNQDSYNLKPVISKSGVVGQDVEEHEEVGDGDDGDDDESTETEEGETETEEDESTETEAQTETASD